MTPVALSYVRLPSPPESVTLIAALALASVYHKLVGLLTGSNISSVIKVTALSTFAFLEGGALAWSYPEAAAPYGALAGWVAFYAQPPLRCRLGEEWVAPQLGSYYGGWVTGELVGPFKDDGVRRQW